MKTNLLKYCKINSKHSITDLSQNFELWKCLACVPVTVSSEIHSLIGRYGPVIMVEGVTGGEISVIPVVACDISSPSSTTYESQLIIILIK